TKRDWSSDVCSSDLKLSKRHGAVSILEYDQEGFLPEAMVNYLARLGWSHGDAELFSRAEFIEWFSTRNLSRSPAQWDPKKLRWRSEERRVGKACRTR